MKISRIILRKMIIREVRNILTNPGNLSESDFVKKLISDKDVDSIMKTIDNINGLDSIILDVNSEPYIWKFFKRYPSPETVTDACLSDIREMIKPLGLSQKRSVALVRMSDDYISKDWKVNPAVLYGIGKYGSDVYRIFCTGEWSSVKPKDHALNDYHMWLKTEPKYSINYTRSCV